MKGGVGNSLGSEAMKNAWLVCALMWLSLAGGAASQSRGTESDSTELELMRLRFARDVIVESLRPLKMRIEELTARAKELAELRDYAGALEVREERSRLEAQLDREDKELLLLEAREQSLRAELLPDVIELPLAEAELSGVTRPAGGGLIDAWSRSGSSATWKLPDLPPGGYEVYLKYRCGALEGGTVLVKEARFTLTGRIETTLKGPERRRVGTLKITDGAGTLEIAAKSVVKDNLMQLLGVELVPASR